MTASVHAIVLAVFTLASCIWVGGYVAIAVVARVASKTLDPAQRVAFFRTLGRAYIRVGLPALVVALCTGAALLSGQRWDGVVAATVIVACVLMLILACGVVQARRMTRLRTAFLATADDQDAAERIRQGAHSAAVLRAFIGVLSLVLVVLGSIIAS